MRAHDEAEFRQYVVARSHALWNTAYLMCGDAHEAEDLVQTALTKAYGAWHRVQKAGNRDAYMRQVLVRCLIDERRRPWRRERAVAELPDDAAVDDVHSGSGSDQRDVLLAALAKVPPRQRATLVLRFWEDQSVEQTAHALGCSTGTVRSQTARGLTALRSVLAESSARDALNDARYDAQREATD